MRKVGKYELLEPIGRGAMGVVWKASDPALRRVVALKIIENPEAEVRTRFIQEGRAAGKLAHGNIVTIYDLGEDPGLLFMAMEFLEGDDLKKMIASGKPSTIEEKLHIMTEVGSAMAHAHRMQVVHRDLKPANIFVTSRGEVKVLDFGLARVISNRITRTGAVLGTPSYMSPEQARGLRADHRSDIFSLGAVYYELTTGRKAFPGKTVAQAFYQILHEDPPPLESVAPDLPPGLGATLMRALAKEPAARYENVDKLLSALRQYREGIEERKRDIRRDMRESRKELETLAEDETLRGDASMRTLLEKLQADLTLGPQETAHPLEELRTRWERIREAGALLRDLVRAKRPQAGARLQGISDALGKSPKTPPV